MYKSPKHFNDIYMYIVHTYSEVATSTVHVAVPMNGDSFSTGESPTKRSAALFLMKTRNEGRLTQSALNSVVHSTSDLCQQITHKLKRKFSEAVGESATMSEDDKQSLIDRTNSIEIDPFEGISTEYLQEKYYKDNFGYLVCVYVQQHTTYYIEDSKCNKVPVPMYGLTEICMHTQNIL